MSKAVVCPVCGGSGKFQQGNETSGRIKIGCPCHGCSGKGWVEIGNSYPTITYYGDIDFVADPDYVQNTSSS